MKKIIRILSFILVLLMMSATVITYANDSDKSATQSVGASTLVYSNDPYEDDLPDNLNYGGATVNILASAKDTVKEEFYASAYSSNAIEKAVYKRNSTVEQRLGVRLNVILDYSSVADISRINQKISSAVNSGVQAYDVGVGAAYLMSATVDNGYIRNLYDCNYLDLEKPYWSQNFNSVFSYKDDTQFLANGSIVLSTYRCLGCTVFNEDIFNGKNEPSLYDVVRDKQ